MSEGRRGRMLLTSGGITLAGIIAWNLGNLVFFVLAARMIGAADFGLVAALVAVTVAALVPCGAIQASIGRVVAKRDGTAGGITHTALVAATRWSLIGGAVGVAVIVLARLIDPQVPAVELGITLVSLLPLVPLHVALGTLQGGQRFGAVAACLTVLGMSRPLLLVLLAPVFSASIAALAASAGSVIAAAALGIAASRVTWSGTADADRSGWRVLLRSMVAPIGALSGIGLLANADIVASKIAFSDVDAGHFGAIAPLGKTAAMIVPMAVAFVLLPRVTQARRDGRDAGVLLALGIVAVLLFDGGILAIAAPATHLIPKIFGSDYVAAGDLLVPVLAASIPLGVLVVLANHHIALGHRRFLWVVLVIGAMTVPAFARWHSSAWTLLTVDAILACGGVLLHEVLYGRDVDGIARGLVRLTGRVVSSRAKPNQTSEP